MKMSVIYYSATANTSRMAGIIAECMNSVSGAEARPFSIDAIDEAFVKESKYIVMGCPTYAADMPTAFHTWLEQSVGKLALSGKLGGAFATAQYIPSSSRFPGKQRRRTSVRCRTFSEKNAKISIRHGILLHTYDSLL